MNKLVCPYCGNELTKNTFWYETREIIKHKCCNTIIEFQKETKENEFECKRCKQKVPKLLNNELCIRCDEALFGVKDEN